MQIARSPSRSHPGGGTCTAIVDHGNPGAWHGTSATAATTVGCTSDAELFEGVLDSGLAQVCIRLVDSAGRRIGLYVEIVLFPLYYFSRLSIRN